MGHKNYQFFVIKGEISQLQTREDVLNLLQPQQGNANLAAGVVGAVTDQFGTAANAAIIGSYEGEEVERFACYIGERLVEGVFSRVMFKNGDKVKAVVEKQPLPHQALYAHAVLRPSDGLLSMPYNTGRGVWAELWKNLRWGGWLSLAVMLMICIFLGIKGWNWTVFFLFFAATPIFMTFMALWAFFAESEGELSTAIFEALYFPRPKSLNLMPSSICPNEGYLHEHSLFRYRRVVSAADDQHGSPEPKPLKRFDKELAEREKKSKRR